jgi:Fic family protein
MIPEQFEPNAPGRVVRSVLGHWTFQPDTLPPQIQPDWATVQRLSEAERALGELAGMGRLIPNPDLLVRPFISREAVESSRIEGTSTRLDQLLLHEAQPDDLRRTRDADEVLNHVRAAEFGLQQVRSGYPITLQLIKELHRTLLTGVRGDDMRPGEIRDRAVIIGRTGQTYETARFVPPCHTTLDPLLTNFIDFLRGPGGLPVIVQAAVMHYQFETIHPFSDGNGRVGRLLITMLLCERGVLPLPLLYLSGFFDRNRDEYYDSLLNVSRRAAWNEWLAYFAYGVSVQARDAAARISRLNDLRLDYHHRSAEAVRSKAAIRVVDELFASPYLTLRRAMEVSGATAKNAQNIIDKFVTAGLLREMTGKQRNRIYCADQVLTVIDQPMNAPAATPSS